ncbi:MAG TPA: hypothetical protein VJT85_07200 [Gemmatimonadaceae bacterium]|nr:hypothetical protein [Gemmatimonadaceae bacterium]
MTSGRSVVRLGAMKTFGAAANPGDDLLILAGAARLAHWTLPS